MAIADRVKEAIDSLNRGDVVNALIQVSIAMDATAKKLHPGRKVGERIKMFVRERQGFITKIAFGILEIRGDSLFTWNSDPRGYKTFEEVIYEFVRCSLLHEGELGAQVKIVKEPLYGMTDDGRVLIYTGLVMALILATMGASVNRNQRLPEGYTANIGQTTVELNRAWGNPSYVYDLTVQHNPDRSV